MPLEIVCSDITKMNVDAIVNAANCNLLQGGGVCGAIFGAAGVDKLQAECDCIDHCEVGDAVITGGHNLPAKHVIHAVGPVWRGGVHNEESLLTSCYKNSLALALKHGFTSIAFPLISSGIYGYPKDEALRVAISTIGSFLLEHEMMVYLVIFDKTAYRIGDKLFETISAYIDGNYVEKRGAKCEKINEDIIQLREMGISDIYSCLSESILTESISKQLDTVVNRIGESFSEILLKHIEESGKTEPEIYKRANLDRKLFSKIRSNPKYNPSKNTALALAIALELNLDKTTDLLRRAGYALSPSSKFDLIVEYFIRERNFNIFEINETLFAFDEDMLGA
jgi:O-acetyl-ADP-ribose deacetylase (regulator of RNase III)